MTNECEIRSFEKNCLNCAFLWVTKHRRSYFHPTWNSLHPSREEELDPSEREALGCTRGFKESRNSRREEMAGPGKLTARDAVALSGENRKFCALDPEPGKGQREVGHTNEEPSAEKAVDVAPLRLRRDRSSPNPAARSRQELSGTRGEFQQPHVKTGRGKCVFVPSRCCCQLGPPAEPRTMATPCLHHASTQGRGAAGSREQSTGQNCDLLIQKHCNLLSRIAQRFS